MAIQARLFNGTVLEFPDGTNPDVINKVAAEQTAAINKHIITFLIYFMFCASPQMRYKIIDNRLK